MQPANDKNSTSSSSYNWSGYVRNDKCNYAEGSWYVPSVSAPGHLPAYSSQWVGLGGYGSNPLVQTGTAASVNNLGTNYYPWYELIGTSYYTDYEIKVNNIPCNPGDQFFCEVETSVRSGYVDVYFYINNYTKSLTTTFTVKIDTPSNMPDSAEWVAERPTINSSYLLTQ
ncbi:G1 family glutamic endopeptidase [Clostridium sp. JNZ X4-2]